MNCQQCGQPLPAGAAHCPACGHQAAAATAAPNPGEFTFDATSGCYYKFQLSTNEAGVQSYQYTYYYPETGKYRYQTYPIPVPGADTTPPGGGTSPGTSPQKSGKSFYVICAVAFIAALGIGGYFMGLFDDLLDKDGSTPTQTAAAPAGGEYAGMRGGEGNPVDASAPAADADAPEGGSSEDGARGRETDTLRAAEARSGSADEDIIADCVVGYLDCISRSDWEGILAYVTPAAREEFHALFGELEDLGEEYDEYMAEAMGLMELEFLGIEDIYIEGDWAQVEFRVYAWGEESVEVMELVKEGGTWYFQVI